MPNRPAFVIAALTALALSVPAAVPTASVDDHWPQWRGPDGLGVAAGTKYAEEWSPQKPTHEIIQKNSVGAPFDERL